MLIAYLVFAVLMVVMMMFDAYQAFSFADFFKRNPGYLTLMAMSTSSSYEAAYFNCMRTFAIASGHDPVLEFFVYFDEINPLNKLVTKKGRAK